MLGRIQNELKRIGRFPGARMVLAGVLLITSFSVLLPKLSQAALDTPQILAYQGRLTDAQKVTVADGAQSMAFVIYDASSGGNCEWTAAGSCGAESTVSVTVTDGLFNVLLGATPQNAFPDALFNTTEQRWLEIRIAGETLTPRRRIVSSATALQAGNASLLDGFDTSQSGGSSAFVPVTDANGSLRMGSVAGPADPTGANGMIVYNTALGKLRCFEGGSWTNCSTAAGSAGGWTDFGSYVNLITASDNVGIGIAGVPTAKLEVSGSSKIYGGQMDLNTTGSGVTNIGSGSSTGAVLIGNSGNTVTIGTDLLAQFTNTYNLGSDTNNWKRLFIGDTGVIFEGSSDNAFETTFNAGNPTADRAINLPDASGNVLLDSNTNIFNLNATSGSSQPIGFGDTITITAGSNISATAGATDTVTVAVVGSPTFTSVISPSYTGAGAVSLTSGSTNSLTLDTSSSSGSVLIGNTNAGALTIGRATVVTTVNGTLTANTFTSTGATITGGTVNGAVIGGVTPAAGTFTTLTTTGNITVGDAATDRITMTGELVLGSISANPTGVNGMMIYNSTDNKFRCFENSVWLDCVSGASAGGWTDDGTIVRLSTGTDQVRINTTLTGNGRPLEVNGIVRSITGGFEFPDGTIQTTAASTSSGVSSTSDVNIASNTDNVSGGDVIISTSTAERMRINSSGNVGIGTSGPGSTLTVAGSFSASGGTINLNQDSNNATAICTGGNCNSTVTIGNTDAGDGNTPSISITSPGWTIDTSGNASGFGTIGADGLVTFTAGLNLSGGTANINQNSNFGTAICTGDGCNGTISIGNNNAGDGNTPLVNITSAGNWSITNTGAFNTASTITSGGLITGNNGITTNTGAVNLLPTGIAAMNFGTNGTYNGAIAIGNTDPGDGGTPTVLITSPGWTIDTAGNASGFGTFGGDGLMSLSAGLTVSSGAINLLSNSTAAINIGTSTTYNGAITIGNNDTGDGGVPSLALVGGTAWSIGTTGTFANSAGATITSSGRITSNGGLTVAGSTIALNDNTNSAVTICTGDSCNATISIGNNNTGDGGTPLVNITSSGNWSITNTGTFNTASTITSGGLITGNNGITTNTGAVNLLPTGTADINFGTNTTYNGTITIGNTDTGDGGSPTLNLRATDMSLSGDAQWSIGATGTFSTSGEYIGSGGMDINAGRIRLRGAAETTGIRIGTNTSFGDPMVIGNSDAGDGSAPSLQIDTQGWSVSTTGNMTGIGSIGADGLITGTAGLAISGASVDLNRNSDAGLRVCDLGGCNAAMTIGNTDGGDGFTPTLTLTTPGWTIDSSGNASGFGTFGGDGLMTLSAGFTMNGGAFNIVTTGTNAINIGTPTNYNGTITIGNTDPGDGGTPTILITAPQMSLTGDAEWSISTGGVITTSGNIAGSGGATFNGGSTVGIYNSGGGAATVNIGTHGSYNGAMVIGNSDGGDGFTPTLAIDTSGWSVTTGGNMSGIGSITADGLITGTAGLAISGASVDLNRNSNAGLRVCDQGGCNAAMTIGNTDGGDGFTPTLTITTPAWGITSGGVVSSSIPGSAFTERLCWDGSGISDIADCSGSPGDYAEMYGTSDSDLHSGELVTLDAMRGAERVMDQHGVDTSKAYVVRAREAYSPLLFGIVATAPNETIGQAIPANENPRPIALSGRVPVKVSEENGRIQIGDPITSSSVPGVGMKATQNGMIVGFALANSTGVEGETIVVSVHTGWWNGASVDSGNTASRITPSNSSALHITSDTDYSLFSIFNIRSIRGLNWSISEAGEFRGSSVAVSKVVLRKTDGGATIGEGVIRGGETSVTVTNAQMKPTSKVFLSWRGNPGSFAMVTGRSEGSFTVTLASTATADAEFDYWIVEVEGDLVVAPTVDAVVPAQSTQPTEPATTTTLTEPAQTTTLTEPAEVIVQDPAPEVVQDPVPVSEPIPDPVPVQDSVPDPVLVTDPVPEPAPELAPEPAPATTTAP